MPKTALVSVLNAKYGGGIDAAEASIGSLRIGIPADRRPDDTKLLAFAKRGGRFFLAFALKARSVLAMETNGIQRGDHVIAAAADGRDRELRALGGVIAGGDFAVVWACSEREWEAARAEGRDPEGIPWPADDVQAGRQAISA